MLDVNFFALMNVVILVYHKIMVRIIQVIQLVIFDPVKIKTNKCLYVRKRYYTNSLFLSYLFVKLSKKVNFSTKKTKRQN